MESVTWYNLRQYQPYTEIFQLQQRLHAQRLEDRIGDSILLLEHSPVITIGRTPGADAHLLDDPWSLKNQGIEVCSTNRGGDITYHGPGQLVVYYILFLGERDIHWFIRNLEKSVIILLAKYEIQGYSRADYPGVWVHEEKICALGIFIRKWVTMHGIALNVCPVRSHFQYIVPCGIHAKGVTSMQKVRHDEGFPCHLNMEQIKQDYLRSFAETFQVEMREGDQNNLF